MLPKIISSVKMTTKRNHMVGLNRIDREAHFPTQKGMKTFLRREAVTCNYEQ